MASSTSLLQHSHSGFTKTNKIQGRTPVVDSYGLTRDKTESARLNAQHDVWKTNIGFLLHPRIKSSLGKAPRIGDIGTGTGIWILELADQLGKHSGATFEGLDMSPEQFPAGPHNAVRFSILNLLDPIPEHLQATFDVLHLRLLVLGLPKGTWEVACQNILSLLKPGGWVQWEEGDFKYDTIAPIGTNRYRNRFLTKMTSSMKVVQDVPGASTAAAQEYFDRLIAEERAHSQGIDDVLHLASYLSKAGFNSVNVDIFSTDRVAGTRQGFNNAMMGAYHGVTTMFIKSDGEASFWTTDAAAKLYADAVSELSDGKVYYRAEINVVCAQRPH